MRCFFVTVVVLLLTACGGGGGGGMGQAPATVAPAPTIPPPFAAIRHVVFIVQENRTFDNLFHGYPGADTVSTGTLHDGTVVQLGQTTFEQNAGGGLQDLDHTYTGMHTAYDGGKMDGFDLELAGALGGQGGPAGVLPYAYVPQAEVAPYWALASKYVLADRMFESGLVPSFNAHQFLVAGQAGGTVGNPNNIPWGCDAPAGTETPVLSNGSEAPGPFPCFNYPTIADEMDAAGISWRYYAPLIFSSEIGGDIWSAFDANKTVRYGPDWTGKIISPETQALTDFAAGNLPAVTWVVPSLQNSDHAGSGSVDGPQWVTNLVNAIGSSRAWSSTAIFIFWDDPGGWYDHAPPPQLDAYGLGFRVPLLVVSPYAKHGYVSHQQHEFGSLLRFVEERFGLAQLSVSDTRADDLSDCFDFNTKPAPFTPFAVKFNAAQMIRRTPAISDTPPDGD